MTPKKYSSEAIILKRRNYSEADRIITVYTKNYGKLTLIAKGVRKPKSRKRGALENFSYIKFSASKGNFLDVMTETEMLRSYSETRADLKRTSVAYYFVEVLDKLTAENEKNYDLFKLLEKYLHLLENNETKLKKLRKAYVFDILTLLGYWPTEKKLIDPDGVLEEVVEREVGSVRVGKKILT